VIDVSENKKTERMVSRRKTNSSKELRTVYERLDRESTIEKDDIEKPQEKESSKGKKRLIQGSQGKSQEERK